MAATKHLQLWTVNALAEELGIHRLRVRKFMKPVPPDGKVQGGRYDAWYLKTAIPVLFQLNGTPDADGDDVIDPEKLHPKDRKDWYHGTESLLKLETLAGNLVPSVECLRELSELAQDITSTIETIPDLLERDCGASPEMVMRAQGIIDQIREAAYKRVVERTDGT